MEHGTLSHANISVQQMAVGNYDILFIQGNNEEQYYWMGNDGGDKLFDIHEWKYCIRIN